MEFNLPDKPFCPEVSTILSSIYPGTLENLVSHLNFANPQTPTLVWTVNLSHLRVLVEKNHNISIDLAECIFTADGWPVRYLAKKLQKINCRRVTGVDLVTSLILTDGNFVVIGSQAKQVEKTLGFLQPLRETCSNNVFDQLIDISDATQQSEIIQMLNEKKPKFVFLALGFPKQEELFEVLKNRGGIPSSYYLGIGGSFQILSKEKHRAPSFIQKVGLEWFWRLAQDPLRLSSRYFSDFVFFSKFLAWYQLEKFKIRFL